MFILQRSHICVYYTRACAGTLSSDLSGRRDGMRIKQNHRGTFLYGVYVRQTKMCPCVCWHARHWDLISRADDSRRKWKIGAHAHIFSRLHTRLIRSPTARHSVCPAFVKKSSLQSDMCLCLFHSILHKLYQTCWLRVLINFKLMCVHKINTWHTW
jgi:hypothetical protein